MAKPGADRVSAIAAEEQLVRVDAQEAGSPAARRRRAWPKAATTICSERRRSGSPSAPVRRATSARTGWRARGTRRGWRGRAHLGEGARRRHPGLAVARPEVRGRGCRWWKEKEREKFLAAESAQDDDDDDDDDDLNPDAGAVVESYDYYDEVWVAHQQRRRPAAATHAQRAERLRRARVATTPRARAKKGEATAPTAPPSSGTLTCGGRREEAPRAAWKASAQAQFLSEAAGDELLADDAHANAEPSGVRGGRPPHGRFAPPPPPMVAAESGLAIDGGGAEDSVARRCGRRGGARQGAGTVDYSTRLGRAVRARMARRGRRSASRAPRRARCASTSTCVSAPRSTRAARSGPR